MEFGVLAVFWVVWLERIKRILEGRGQMFNGTKLGYITLGLVSSDFQEFPFSTIFADWKAILIYIFSFMLYVS